MKRPVHDVSALVLTGSSSRARWYCLHHWRNCAVALMRSLSVVPLAARFVCKMQDRCYCVSSYTGQRVEIAYRRAHLRRPGTAWVPRQRPRVAQTVAQAPLTKRSRKSSTGVHLQMFCITGGPRAGIMRASHVVKQKLVPGKAAVQAGRLQPTPKRSSS